MDPLASDLDINQDVFGGHMMLINEVEAAHADDGEDDGVEAEHADEEENEVVEDVSVDGDPADEDE